MAILATEIRKYKKKKEFGEKHARIGRRKSIKIGAIVGAKAKAIERGEGCEDSMKEAKG
jgi:hypothetical protein